MVKLLSWFRPHPYLILGVVALPWLAAPAMILLVVSRTDPQFTARYLEFSQRAGPCCARRTCPVGPQVSGAACHGQTQIT